MFHAVKLSELVSNIAPYRPPFDVQYILSCRLILHNVFLKRWAMWLLFLLIKHPKQKGITALSNPEHGYFCLEDERYSEIDECKQLPDSGLHYWVINNERRRGCYICKHNFAVTMPMLIFEPSDWCYSWWDMYDRWKRFIRNSIKNFYFLRGENIRVQSSSFFS